MDQQVKFDVQMLQFLQILGRDGRDTQTDLARFVHIAFSSASELDYHLLLAHDLGFIEKWIYQELETAISEIKRMLHDFEKSVSSNAKKA